MPQESPRFIVLGAKTMLELVDMMNKSTYPLVQLKYLGINIGDYTGYIDEARLKAAIVIAVFDAAPVLVSDIHDIEIEGFDPVSGNLATTMSA